MHNTEHCLWNPSDSSRAARDRAREATCSHHLRWSGQAQPGWAPPSLVIAASPLAPVAKSSTLRPSPIARLRRSRGYRTERGPAPLQMRSRPSWHPARAGPIGARSSSMLERAGAALGGYGSPHPPQQASGLHTPCRWSAAGHVNTHRLRLPAKGPGETRTRTRALV